MISVCGATRKQFKGADLEIRERAEQPLNQNVGLGVPLCSQPLQNFDTFHENN